MFLIIHDWLIKRPKPGQAEWGRCGQSSRDFRGGNGEREQRGQPPRRKYALVERGLCTCFVDRHSWGERVACCSHSSVCPAISNTTKITKTLTRGRFGEDRGPRQEEDSQTPSYLPHHTCSNSQAPTQLRPQDSGLL